MNANKFSVLQLRIERILSISPVDSDVMHSNLVLKWVLEFRPDADEALKLAALSHDIERAITGITEKDRKPDTPFDVFKQKHADRSALFISGIMKAHDYDEQTIERVRHLVEKHEVGGDAESKILMEADSLAFFEYNISSFLDRNGPQRTKEKIKVMYKRLSEQAKAKAKIMKFSDEKTTRLFYESVSEIGQG